MEIFSTREVATAIWIFGAFLACLKVDGIAQSFLRAIKGLFKVKVLAVFEALAVYLMVVCFILAHFFSWGIGEIKSATFWFLFVGLVLLFQAVEQGRNYHPIRSWLKNTFTFIILLEFLTSKYTFALWIEFIFVPVVSFVALMYAFSGLKSEHRTVEKLFEWVLAIVGIFMLTYATRQFLGDVETGKSWEIAKDFSLPILYSLLTIPFFWGLHVYLTYENTFSTLTSTVTDIDLRKQFKCIAIKRFGLHLSALRRWGRIIRSDKPKSVDDVHKTISEAHEVESLFRNPPNIAQEDGWSPFYACAFLQKRGVKMLDYREYAGKWHADSHAVYTGKGYPKNFIHYMIDGTQTEVKTLRLKLTLNDLDRREEDLATMKTLVKELMAQAFPSLPTENEVENILSEIGQEIILNFSILRFNCEFINVGDLSIEEYEFRIEMTI